MERRRFSLDHLPPQDAANAHSPVETGYASIGGSPGSVSVGPGPLTASLASPFVTLDPTPPVVTGRNK